MAQKYGVYQATAPGTVNEHTLRQHQMDSRDLQPQLLRDYYQPEIDVNHATYPIPDQLAHNSEPLSLKQR